MNTANTKHKSIEEFGRLAVKILSDNLGDNVVLLDVRVNSDYSDFLVITSGKTDQHLESLSTRVTKDLRNAGLRVHHKEGSGSGGWILLDFLGLVTHIFSDESRKKYDIENLLGGGREIVRLQ